MLPLPLPLLRVLDLTTSVAGASASRMLGDFGAEVIVVERPGAARDVVAQYGRNKFSCAIDVSAAASLDLLLRLGAACHLVLVDAGEEAGIGYAALRALRDDIVLVSIGEGGARPGVGNVAAAAAMTALFHVRFRGKGQQVDVAFPALEASVSSAAIVAASAGVANASPDLPPSGCYACSDGPLALVVRSIEQLAALGEVIGRPEQVDAVTGGEELREAVAAWAAPRSARDAAALLRKAGIAAQELLTSVDLRDDPHLRARGVFEAVASGSGVSEVDGPRLRFSDTPLHTRLPAPAYGEHTAAVLQGALGLSDAEIVVLAASGVVGSAPEGAQ